MSLVVRAAAAARLQALLLSGGERSTLDLPLIALNLLRKRGSARYDQAAGRRLFSYNSCLDQKRGGCVSACDGSRHGGSAMGDVAQKPVGRNRAGAAGQRSCAQVPRRI